MSNSVDEALHALKRINSDVKPRVFDRDLIDGALKAQQQRIETLEAALFAAQRRFELLHLAGVREANGILTGVGAKECAKALNEATRIAQETGQYDIS